MSDLMIGIVFGASVALFGDWLIFFRVIKPRHDEQTDDLLDRIDQLEQEADETHFRLNHGQWRQ